MKIHVLYTTRHTNLELLELELQSSRNGTRFALQANYHSNGNFPDGWKIFWEAGFLLPYASNWKL